ncbi:MAG: hypothetical protein GC202_03655 [Alphaproteobacteria bacterium]|nr:hypothetical protein [Alphaproteobacteria bacterium]
MRALKTVVIGLGVLCAAAFGVLVWLVASKAGGRSAPPAPASAAAPSAVQGWGELDLGLPAGSRIVAIAASGATLAIQVRLPDGAERIIVVDPGTGTPLGRIVPGEK